VFPTDDPTLLGIGWCIIATWWVGLLLGIPLAIAARAGNRPKRSVGSLVRPLACLLAVMAVSAALAGYIGWVLASRGIVFLWGHLPRLFQLSSMFRLLPTFGPIQPATCLCSLVVSCSWGWCGVRDGDLVLGPLLYRSATPEHGGIRSQVGGSGGARGGAVIPGCSPALPRPPLPRPLYLVKSHFSPH